MVPKFSPAILKVHPEPFDHPDWLFELKYDGFRTLATCAGGSAELVSRKNHTYKSFENVRRSVLDLGADCVLDGELVCLAEDGRPVFNDLLRRRANAYLYIFDCLWLDGRNLTSLPLLVRKQILRKLIPDSGSFLLYVSHREHSGVPLFQEVCRWDVEGVIAKPKLAPYGKGWLKILNRGYSQKRGRHELFRTMRTG